MASHVLRTEITRHDSALGWWEMASRAPHPAVRPHVRRYVGWFEHMAVSMIRRELPTEEVPVIINFGSPIRVFAAGDASGFTDFGSFTTGAYDAYVRVRSEGLSGGVQINFTVLGARLFLNRPLGELRNRAVALDDVLGPFARQLADALYNLPTWEARFALLDRAIGARLDAATAPSASVLCTWHRLLESGGAIRIAAVVDEVGWSQKHLIARFRHEIGLAPKTMARVLRFARAAAVLRQGHRRLADIAADCGYYDQAHFTRDFREFAGVTPSELMASVLPDGAGLKAS